MLETTYRIKPLSSSTFEELRHPVTIMGEGKPILLVHGYPLTRQMWNRVWEPLSRKFQVIAPDLRGFADQAPDVGAFQLGDLADDLASLLSEMGVDVPVTLVGLSMGGYVALEFCVRYRSQVESLVLCDTRATGDTAESVEQRKRSAAMAREAGAEAAVEGMISKLVAPEVVEENPAWFANMVASMGSRTANNLAHAQLAMASRRDFSSFLSSFDFPTRCIVGGRDMITPPAEMQSMALKIPGAEYHLISGAGHLPPLERPEAFLAALLG